MQPPALLLLGAALAAGTTLLPPQGQMMGALGVIIVLGVPHGALDGELARTALRPRLGRAWLPAFALPYLALSALVLAAWHIAPVTTLVMFLGLSVWHFGVEDTGTGSPVDALIRGGLPIAVPMLAHRAGTVALFETVAGTPLTGFAPLWTGAAVAWAVLAAAWTARALTRRRRDLLEPGLLLGALLTLSPLTGFALYFVCVHAPAHTAALVRDGQASRVHDARSAWWRALPFTGLTVALGAALWPLYHGAAAPRLLALTIQVLAALTLPHMLFGACIAAWGAPAIRIGRQFA